MKRRIRLSSCAGINPKKENGIHWTLFIDITHEYEICVNSHHSEEDRELRGKIEAMLKSDMSDDDIVMSIKNYLSGMGDLRITK